MESSYINIELKWFNWYPIDSAKTDWNVLIDFQTNRLDWKVLFLIVIDKIVIDVSA